MAAPEQFVAHLVAQNYHPRSNKHGIALCDSILEDLLARCPRIAADAAARRLVYERNQVLIVGSDDWNIDLVIGPPSAGFVADPLDPSPIAHGTPAAIRIAIEAKTIMTAHGKARRNRQRDLGSFHSFANRYDNATISAAVTVLNVAGTFKSPLKLLLTTHRNIARVAASTMLILRGVLLRASLTQPGLDANTVIVVEHDNVNPANTRLVAAPPAPQMGDPLHYDSFLLRICDRYSQRWP